MEGGANDYVIKPIDEDILLDKVRAQIRDDVSDAGYIINGMIDDE